VLCRATASPVVEVALAAGSQPEVAVVVLRALDVQLPRAFLWQTLRTVLGREAVLSNRRWTSSADWRLDAPVWPGLLDPASIEHCNAFWAMMRMSKRYQLASRLRTV